MRPQVASLTPLNRWLSVVFLIYPEIGLKSLCHRTLCAAPYAVSFFFDERYSATHESCPPAYQSA